MPRKYLFFLLSLLLFSCKEDDDCDTNVIWVDPDPSYSAPPNGTQFSGKTVILVSTTYSYLVDSISGEYFIPVSGFPDLSNESNYNEEGEFRRYKVDGHFNGEFTKEKRGSICPPNVDCTIECKDYYFDKTIIDKVVITDYEELK